jgi:hypothetical protein
VNIRPRSITSLTLARHGQHDYRITIWPDGVARFDGCTNTRQGAWEGHFDPQWFAWIAGLAKDIEPGKQEMSDSPVTLVVETADNRFVYESGDKHEPGSFWLVGTVIDGLAHRVHWIPLDVTGANDFARWMTGVSVWMSIGNAIASGFAADGSIIVLAGGQASTTTSPSLEANYKEMRTSLINDDALSLDGDHFRITRHLHFASPSAAASVLVGSNTSGRRAWRNSKGHAWSELDLDA